MKELTIKTNRREEFINITNRLQAIITTSDWARGALVVFSPHTTAALTINEAADPTVTADMTAFLRHMIPQSPNFKHAEGNSDAHLKTSILSPSLMLIVEHGMIQLGTWQGVYLFEGDGPRERNVWVQFVSACT